MTMAVRESRAGIEPRASQDKNCLAWGSAMGEISVLLGGGLSSGSLVPIARLGAYTVISISWSSDKGDVSPSRTYWVDLSSCEEHWLNK